MINKNEVGYIQLVDLATNEVIQQRKGSINEIEYISNNVWFIDSSVKVVFSKESDLVQPCFLFNPVKADAIIKIYSEHVGDVLPKNDPVWHGCAAELDLMSNNISCLVGDLWSIFDSNGNLIGTSEI